MKTKLAFGRCGLEVDLPDGFEYVTLDVKSASALPDAGVAIASALDNPIGSPSLTERARGKRTAAISVCDFPCHTKCDSIGPSI